MAVEVPTAAVALKQRHFLRDQPLLSGEDAADREGGWRGLLAQTNHVYAHAIQTLSEGCEVAGSSIFSTASTSFVAASETVVIEQGADIVDIIVLAEVEDAAVEIFTELGQADSGSAITGRGTATATLTVSDATGVDNGIIVRIKARSGQTGILYSFVVREVAMVAGDFP